jgi:hypothetical protein
MVEGGTWEELSAAHRDLVAAKKTLSGLLNLYRRIPYRFLAAVEILGLSAIGDALVGRRKWDSVAVAKEMGIVFRKDKRAIDRLIQESRERAI